VRVTLLEARAGVSSPCWARLARPMDFELASGCGILWLCFVKAFGFASDHSPLLPKGEATVENFLVGLLGFDGGDRTHKNNRRK